MTHIPDHELLLEADGELDLARTGPVRRHLSECRVCSMRQAELVAVLSTAVDQQLARELPPAESARQRLQTSLGSSRSQQFMALAALAAALLMMVFPWVPFGAGAAAPRAGLTPGAVREVNQAAMCAMGEEGERPAISHRVAMEVFRSYGIHDPQPRAYEVDYLIPPDLGGSDDVRNLWPQPYNEGTWNARVKDALEDRLRTMVCTGTLELSTAQQELATDWIGAYQRHFRTTSPLPDHVAFVKDQPWE